MDVVRADQAMVRGRVSWTGQATAAGFRKSGGHPEQAVPDGRHTGIDMARVAGSNVDTASRTSSVWVGVELAKLYTGVGLSDLDSGIAGISQPAYLGQPIQLRPAAHTQLVSGYVCHPLVMDPGAGMAPVPTWNRSVSCGFKPHQDNQRACHPMLQRKAGRRASCLKPGECGHRLDSQERLNSTSR